ncbi:MAG: SPOR domain-containing protein, partial [Rhizobium sp.]
LADDFRIGRGVGERIAGLGLGGNALANASPYTEVVGKGSNTVYRARFVGFGSRDDANSACAALKRNDFDCMLLPSKG